MSKTDKQKRLKSTVLAVAIALAPMAAQAAGLGKLTVISALGQPLKAEIDLTASREEYSSITARLAPAEAFRSAGIEYAPVLSTIRFTLDKRTNGQPFLRVTSDRPLNEPFVDMLVEVNWASGRLVREYTFLLDPPDVFQKPVSAPAPVAAPEVKKEIPSPPVAKTPEAVAPQQPEIRPEPPAEEKPAKKPAAEAAKRPAERPAAKPVADRPQEGGTRVVKAGDTLAKIATETKPEGVSLDQMLVALFRTNKDVFDGGNMNRLRAGKILTIPEKDAVVGIEQGEARKVVVAQAADFNAYRKKLAAVAAAGPAKEEAPKQVATGRITPKVEDKAPAPAAGKDKLEVSRSDAGKDGGKVGKGRAVIEEDLIARDKALKDANSRIAQLEKNLADLKQLAELKSAAGAKVQAQAQAAKPVAEPKKPEPPAVKPAEPPRTVEAPKPAEAEKPAEAAKPVEPVAKPPAPKKPVVPPPPPPEPPSFMEENSDLVFGGGGIIALLLGYLGFNAWRKKKQAAVDAGGAADSVAASSVFASSGSETIDTGAAMPTDFSPDSVAGMAGDEGVDPVAEADVYIAYGRDKQAEEILLEALKTDPARCAIHLKLLEIYSSRRDVQRFEAVARDLHGLTGGNGEDWARAAALGLTIDPTNPLYGGVPAAPEAPAAAPAQEPSVGGTVVMAGALAGMAAAVAEATPEVVVPEPEVAPEEVPASLDFDLDLGGPAPEAVAEAAPEAPAAPAEDVMSLDFDLDLGAPSAEAPVESAPEAAAEAPAAEEAAVLDFDLGGPAEEVAAPQVPATESPAAEEAPAAAPEGGETAALDFDFDLGTPAGEAPAPEAQPEPASLDLSSISLDLGEPVAEVAEEAPVVEPAAQSLDMPVVELAPEDLAPAVPAAEPAADVSLDMPVVDLAPEDLAPAVPAAEPAADVSLAMPAMEMEAAPVAPVVEEAAPALEMPAIDMPQGEALDLSLDLAAEAPVEAPAPEAAAAEEISFDLELPPVEESAEAAVPAPEAAPAAPVEDNPEVATKLELALAYEEMGDKEGARELLMEVINEGSPAQQEMARNKLATLD